MIPVVLLVVLAALSLAAVSPSGSLAVTVSVCCFACAGPGGEGVRGRQGGAGEGGRQERRRRRQGQGATSCCAAAARGSSQRRGLPLLLQPVLKRASDICRPCFALAFASFQAKQVQEAATPSSPRGGKGGKGRSTTTTKEEVVVEKPVATYKVEVMDSASRKARFPPRLFWHLGRSCCS